MNTTAPTIGSQAGRPSTVPLPRFYFWLPSHSNDPIPANFGDDLFGKIVGKLIGREITACSPNYSGAKVFIGGSTLGYARNGDHVWGAGIRDGSFNPHIQFLKVHAVRGPKTAGILRARGIAVP